jgi:hypothetical protein
METHIISVLYTKPLMFFNVIQIHDHLIKNQIDISKEQISDTLQYFFNKNMLCRIKSEILNTPYLYYYGMRIIYKTPNEWEFMHNSSEFIRTD